MSPPKEETVPEKNGRYAPLELKLAVLKAYLGSPGTARKLSQVYGISPKCIYERARNSEIEISVPLPAGAKEIELKVDECGDNACDWSVWAYPRFVR